MFKIAILGVENSHAVTFLDEYKAGNPYDIEVIGIYSDEENAAADLSEKYGVKMMASFDELAGKIDGVVITARHGDNHYRYAKPYIKYGIPMMIDKPITCSEEDALLLARELKANNIKVCGGSIVPLAPVVGEFNEIIATKPHGRILGGNISCPVSLTNDYGNFYFYSQHLAESLLRIFGMNVESVYAKKRDNAVSVIASYPEFDVTANFLEGGYKCYSASVYTEKEGTVYAKLDYSGKSFAKKFADMIRGTEEGTDLTEFIKPVFLINAIIRSYESGKTEKLNDFTV